MFINLDASKKFEFAIMIYILKKNLVVGVYSTKKTMKLILFLSQLLNLVETWYWPIELELAGII